MSIIKVTWAIPDFPYLLLQDKTFLDSTLVLSSVEALQNFTKGKKK